MYSGHILESGGMLTPVSSLRRYFPVVIDQVMHSMAIGFVGTDQSTLSLVGGLRVKTWNGGVSRTVLWGHKNADSH